MIIDVINSDGKYENRRTINIPNWLVAFGLYAICSIAYYSAQKKIKR